jgi:tetratricopeptide (TPR) repeat protein
MADMRQQLIVKSLTGLLVILQVAACTTAPVFESEAESVRLDQLIAEIETPDPSEYLLHVPVSMQQALDRAIDEEWSQRRKFRALRKYLFDEETKNVQYRAEATLTAAQAFERQEGNCLSISNLFIASARHLGIDASYQTVWVRPTWENEGVTMIRYEHIVAVGRLDNGDDYVVDFLPEFSESDRGKEIITDIHALALFHNNLGAEAVVRRDLPRAEQELLLAAKLWPENSDIWNNLGAAWRRQERLDLAESSYKRALRLETNNYSALANLTQFYLGQDRREAAEQFLKRVTRYYRRNPYYYYYMAQLFYREGSYEEAREQIRTAIRLKNDDPDFYRALSDIHRRLGNDARADQLAEQAARVKPRRAQLGGERKAWARTFRVSR